MKRQQFIRTIGLSGLALPLLPQMAFSSNIISTKELFGKGTPKLYGNGYNLREEAHFAFLKLKADASKEGIKINVVSSYRNFDHQKRIWERKFKRYTSQGLSEMQSINKIIEYSTIPGTSRHHWGTDLDIVDANAKQPSSLLQPTNFDSNGPFCKLKEWMDENATNYGFHLVYTDLEDRKGFKYEPWHYSYKPLSSAFLKQYRTLDIKSILKKEKLGGSNFFSETFMNKYVSENILDINPELL